MITIAFIQHLPPPVYKTPLQEAYTNYPSGQLHKILSQEYYFFWM